MKPIRIYASFQELRTSEEYYTWKNGSICQRGNGCKDNCVFYGANLPGCTVLNIMDQIVQTYKPLHGYIELTLDSHPEVFL